METQKLPVLKIFMEAVTLPIDHFKMLLKLTSPYVVVLLAITTYLHTQGYSIVSEELGWKRFLYALPLAVLLIMAVVRCHRVYLSDPEERQNIGIFNWTGNELRYLGWWVLIALLVGIIAVIIGMIFGPLSSLISSPALFVLISNLALLPAYYAFSCWSLLLPAAAIGKRKQSMGDAVALSEGNGWRLTVLVCLLPLIINILLDLLPLGYSLAYTLLKILVWLIVAAIEIGLLSLSFAYLTAANSTPPEDQDAPLELEA